MQMTDKQNKIAIKPSSNKLWVVCIMLILGGGILVALYINFQLTYKVDDINQRISKIGSNQKKVIELSKNPHPIQKELPPTKETINVQPKEKESLSDPYLALYDFIHDFYKIKSIAEKGKDFTQQLLDLKHYTISSEELTQHLDNLIDLASCNKQINYFKLEFNNIITTLYQQPSHYSFININDYIFIRPIGERAIENGGIDKQVALIEQALSQNDLEKVDEHLQDLPQDINSLNHFKVNVKKKLAIQDELNKIEEILLNKQNINIVSK